MAVNPAAYKAIHSPSTLGIGKYVEDVNFMAIMRRRSHERRWYDNNFFDDGYHFRLVSKKTGRVIDSINKSTGYVERAIPRASRQIRGVTNLLFTPEYYPVVYPERISQEEFMRQMPDGQFQLDQASYQIKLQQIKRAARLRGVWITKQWEDELDMDLKLVNMMLLAAKNSIAYMQIYTDPKTRKLCADIYDAFDLIHFGDKYWLNELPFITKATPWLFNDVLTSPIFDEERLEQLNPDNAYATSEIKNAYMRSRFGSKQNDKEDNTIIVRETFMREYLSDENWEQAKKLGEDTGAMEGKSKGDMIMRHPFSAGGVTLHDEYINYDRYPFAEFRFEPGFLYQVPLIERFIPLNKSLDVVMTRVEKFINAMVVGVYQKRKGENMQVSNFPGGQMLEYEQQPLTQMQLTNPGQAPFAFMELLDKYMEEQGASTFTLNNLPQGVTANAAYESAQQREYMNMKVATKMLKKTISDIANLMMERAHKDMIDPEEVEYKENGQPQYFTVIGKKGYEAHTKVKSNKLPSDAIVLDKGRKVHVEIEPGLGLTMQGKREAMDSIIKNMIQLFQLNFLSPQALSMAIKKYLETFGYGSTEEFMEGVENGVTQGTMNNTQIMQMQIAVVKALRDAKAVGPEATQQLVDSTKLGVLQTLKEAGLLDQLNAKGDISTETEDLIKLYKDATPDIRRQIEQKLGLQPAQDEPISPSQAQSAVHLNNITQSNKPEEPKPNGQQ